MRRGAILSLLLLLAFGCAGGEDNNVPINDSPADTADDDIVRVDPKTTGSNTGQTGSSNGQTQQGAKSNPRISSLSPSDGPLLGGIVIRILGSGIDPQAKVFIGRFTAQVKSADEKGSWIEVLLPDGSSAPDRRVDVRLVNPDQGTATFTSFTYIEPAAVVAVVPAEPVIGLDPLITISISHAKGLSKVEAAGRLLALSGSGDQRQAQLPLLGNESDGDLLGTLTFENGTSQTLVLATLRNAKPTLLSAVPLTFNSDGGELITLTGSELIPGLKLMVGSVQVSSYSVLDRGSRLTFTMPELPEGSHELKFVLPGDQEAILPQTLSGIKGYGVPALQALTPGEAVRGQPTIIEAVVRYPGTISSVSLGTRLIEEFAQQDEQLTFSVPLDLGEGLYDLTLTRDEGKSSTFPLALKVRLPAPVLGSPLPLSMGPAGGDSIFFFGAELLPPFQLYLGDQLITDVTTDERGELLSFVAPPLPLSDEGYPIKLVSDAGEFLAAAPLRVVSVELALDVVPEAETQTQVISFDLTVDASHAVIAVSPAARNSLGVEVPSMILSVVDPDGTTIVDESYYGNSSPLGRIEPKSLFLPNALLGPFEIDHMLKRGRWRIAVAVDSASLPALVNPHLAHKIDNDLNSGTLTLSVFLVGAFYANDDYTNLDLIVDEVRRIYQQANVSINPAYLRIDLTDDPSFADLTNIDDYQYGGDAPKARQLMPWSMRGSSGTLPVFFVQNISGEGIGGTVAGISSLPGPFAMATQRSGVIIQTQFMRFSELSGQDVEQVGATLAHELGHYLGLYHPSEITQQGMAHHQVFDPLTDTPECLPIAPAENLALNTISTDCAGLGYENLMFPIAGGTSLSVQQSQVLNLNPFVQ